MLAAIARDERLEIDASLFLPGHPHLRPVRQWLLGTTITRIPYFWSEDHEMERPEPTWSLAELLAVDGLKVLNFHPIHVFLNSATEAPYSALQASSASLRSADLAIAERHVNLRLGSRTVFDEAVEHLVRVGASPTLSDIAREHGS